MLSREENELVTRVGQGTPMGNTMRRYWIPALLSREIAEPDGPPVRVRLLGEDLVAFRDSEGRIGLLDEFCPHRRVSLYFGRNEECGLRCVYHGWKFDVAGTCVDMMNEPEEIRLQAQGPHHRVSDLRTGRHRLGLSRPAPRSMPPLPKFAWTQAPEAHRHVTKVIQECNWLQGAGRRHRHLARADPAPAADRQTSKRGGIKPSNPFVRGKAPKLVVDVTDYGYQYAGIRPLRRHRRAHPHLPVRHAVPSDPPVEVGERPGARCRPHLGADR